MYPPAPIACGMVCGVVWCVCACVCACVRSRVCTIFHQLTWFDTKSDQTLYMQYSLPSWYSMVRVNAYLEYRHLVVVPIVGRNFVRRQLSSFRSIGSSKQTVLSEATATSTGRRSSAICTKHHDINNGKYIDIIFRTDAPS